MGKKLKDFLVILVFAFATFAIDNGIFIIVWPLCMGSQFQLLQTVVFPTAVICLVKIISISIVAFFGGAFFRIRSKIAFLGAVTYIFLDWANGLAWLIFRYISGVGETSLRLILFMSIDDIIIFLTIPFAAIWLCYSGIKLRSLIKNV